MTDESGPATRVAQNNERANVPWYRRTRRRIVVSLLLSALLGVGLGQLYLAAGRDDATQTDGASKAFSTGATEFPVTERGRPVDVSGAALSGDPLALSDLRDRVVVVNVWGSWCPPCREEAPVLAEVSAEYGARGVSFVGINVRDNPAAARAFEENYGIDYPSIEDTDGRVVLALDQYIPASAVPVTLVLDREGRVAARVLGAVREAALRTMLDTALGE